MASQIYTTGTSGDSRLFYQDPSGSYKQIANPTELQNLAKAGTVQVGGERGVLSADALAQINGTSKPTTQQATSPTQNIGPMTTQGSFSPSSVGSLEVNPGTYSSSALIDYYNKELERNRPQYEQAQSTLSGLNQQLQQIYGGPSLQETYNKQLSSATAGIDQQLLQTTEQLKGIDTALAGVEQEVRARIGQGQAPESYIQAEIARQSTPLINQRSAIANSLNALQDQRQNALQGVSQGMQYFEADRNRQLSLLDAQRQLAQQTVDSFSTIMEKGAAATEKERQSAREMFMGFLEKSPDFVTSLDENELKQLQRGVIPYSAIGKLGAQMKQQQQMQMAGDNQLVGSGETGYFLVNKFTGESQQVIAPKPAGAGGASESDIRSLATAIFDRDPSIASYADAYMQAQQMLGASGGFGGAGSYGAGLSAGLSGGAYGGQSQQTGMTYEQFANKYQENLGMSIEPAKIRSAYDKYMESQAGAEPVINDRVSQFGRRKDDKYFSQVSTLRDDYTGNPVVKNYLIQKDAYQAASGIDPNTNNPQDDIALVYSFMKVLDPTSVVRETEFNTAAKASSLLNQFNIKVGKVASGQILNPAVRQNIIDTMTSRFGKSADNYASVVSGFTAQARNQRIDPQDFIIDYSSNVNASGGGYDTQGFISSFTNDPSTSVNGSLGARQTSEGPNMSYADTRSTAKQSYSMPSMSVLQKYLPSANGKTFSFDKSQMSYAPKIGNLSAKYESGGSPGAIGYDNTGGYSYGTYQLAHNNAKKFVEQSKYAKEFSNIPFNSKAFQNKWKEIAARDPQGFAADQHRYIEKTHFDPQAKKLASIGLDIRRLSPVLQDVIWSTAVQHGPANDIILQAVKATKNKADPVEFIKNVYNLRWARGRNFARSTDNVKNSVYNRFFGPSGEMARAIAQVTKATNA